MGRLDPGQSGQRARHVSTGRCESTGITMTSALTDHESARQISDRLMILRKDGGVLLTLALSLPLVSGGLLVAQAWLLAHVLGMIIEGGVPVSDLSAAIAGIAGLWILRAVLGQASEQAGTVGAERIKSQLRTSLLEHLLATRRKPGMAPASGAVSAAMIEQVDALEAYFARYLPALVNATVLPLAFAVVMIPLDWIVATLFLVSAPLIPIFMALAGLGAQAATDRQASAFARLSGYFSDRLRGIVTLKLFGRERAATAQVHEASEELRKRSNAVLAIAFLSSAILEFFAALGIAGVALYVGLTYLELLPFHPGLTLSAGLFALLMAPEVYQPLRQLAAHYHDRAAAKSALGEIEAQVCDYAAPRLLPAQPITRQTCPRASSLAVRNLGVVTTTGDTILDALDLNLAPAEHLALLGPSGSGKSTFVRAIAQLGPYSGNIELGETDLAAMQSYELRQRVVIVGQKPWIFRGTVADNIRFARPKAAEAKIERAAQTAGVAAFLRELPNGLDTRVGEGGYGLSGGQAQRVALARLFLTDPDLVLLDEPTAHLDADTQADVLDAIIEFCTGRSLIVVTHAAAVAARADRVLQLVGGGLMPMPMPYHPTGKQAGKERVA